MRPDDESDLRAVPLRAILVLCGFAASGVGLAATGWFWPGLALLAAPLLWAIYLAAQLVAAARVREHNSRWEDEE